MTTELESTKRMFAAACTDLGAINQALGLDPDDGGAAPIIDAINKLKGEAGVMRSLLVQHLSIADTLTHEDLELCYEACCSLLALKEKTEAAVRGAP